MLSAAGRRYGKSLSSLAFAFLLVFTFNAANVSGQTPARKPTIQEESKVLPYTLPDPLKMENGETVLDAKTWREKRRPELMQLFEREVYGKIPIGKPENLRFVLREEKSEALGGKATRLRVGVLFDGRDAGPGMELLVYLPNKAKGPVPVFLGLNFEGNYTTTADPDLPLPMHWVPGPKSSDHRAKEANRGKQASRWQYEYAIDHGYGVATACYGEVEADDPELAKAGVHQLAPAKGGSDWGSLAAWGWALSRAFDYLETNSRVDSKRIILMGHSRLGKAALWAGARDERFALVISNDSGAGGAALSRRIYGETVANLTTSFPHWFCPEFQKYADHEELCPVDQHELIALIAPRPVLINSATEDLWADPKGEFLAAAGADPVYRLLGTDGISTKDWPEPSRILLSRIGYFLRPGKHDVTREDWEAYIAFADHHLKENHGK